MNMVPMTGYGALNAFSTGQKYRHFNNQQQLTRFESTVDIEALKAQADA